MSVAKLAAAAWRPAGLVYLVMMLLAMAAGMWPNAIYPPREALVAAPLPVLQTLAVAQTVFALLVYPLVLLRRSCVRPFDCDQDKSSGCELGYWASVFVESGFLILAAAPFYILAAFLADGQAGDAIRSALCGMSCLPLAWLAGAYFQSRRPGQWALLLGLVLISFGPLVAFYLALEFFPPGQADLWGNLSALLTAWRNGAAHFGGGLYLPQPLWAWLLWPALAGAGLLAGMILFPPGKNPEKK